MATRIGIVNRKGGVGKTTTALILADAFTRLQLKTLLIDFDGQANCTSTVGCEPVKTIADVLDGKADIKDIIYKESEIADLVPSGSNLDVIKDSLISKIGSDVRLRNVLDQIDQDYDIIIIDSNPSSDILTRNVLAAVDGIVIPSELETYAIDGILKQTAAIDEAKIVNKTLKLYGVLITDFENKDSTHRSYNDVVGEFKEYGIHVFNTYIRHSAAIPSVQRWRRVSPETVADKKIANSRGSIFAYDSNNNATKDYFNFAQELIEIIKDSNQ